MLTQLAKALLGPRCRQLHGDRGQGPPISLGLGQWLLWFGSV